MESKKKLEIKFMGMKPIPIRWVYGGEDDKDIKE